MSRIEIELIGGLRVRSEGREVPLPASRKARALLVWLVLEPGEHRRGALGDLLWPETADPRAGLRWGLTKLRRVLGAEALLATTEGVQLDRRNVRADVDEVTALLADPDAVDTATLQALAGRFEAAPLRGLEAAAGAEFELWLESQQDRLGRLHQRLLTLLTQRLPADAALPVARQRVALDPLNQAANEALLALTREVAGRQEGQAALERMRQRFRAAGLADGALLAAWRRLSAAQAPLESIPTPSEMELDRTLELPARPSVAVLGFEHLGETAAVLAEGLGVDLTFKLARLKGLFVTARGSARRFTLAQHDAAAIGRALGVRYLVHGTAQQLDRRMRVTVDLVECAHGEAVWSERFERALTDLFAVQDDMADAIVAALQPQIERAEQERARFLPTEHLGAWECYHRALWHGFRFTRTDNERAFELMQRALELDPDFARAHAGLSFNLFSRVFLNASADPQSDLAQALERARHSVSLEPRDALGHWSLGRALFLAGEHDQALTALDRALMTNPNYAQGHYARGFVECHGGMPDRAMADLDMARRLSPFDPLLFAMEASRAVTLALCGRYPEAAEWAVQATREPHAHFHIFAIAAACLELAGRHEEASRNVSHARSMHPPYSVAVFERSFPQRPGRDRRIISDALHAAGLPRR